MGLSHPPPSPGNGPEPLGQLSDNLRLLFRLQHQVAIALLMRGESGEDPAPDTKIGRTHVRALFRARQAQRNPAKICCIHLAWPLFSREYPTLWRHQKYA